MIASPPIEIAVETPRPAAVSVDEISVVMPPERDITPTGPGEYALAASLAGPPMPPILATPGEIRPRQLGPMIRAPRRLASSTIWATSRRGIRSVTTTISVMPFSIASNTASLVNAGGTVTTAPSGAEPWCSTICSTVSNTGTPWTSRPLRPGVTPPTIFEP
jgi:hypothetical protein